MRFLSNLRISLNIFACSLALLSCKKEKFEVRGEVFIVTNGGQNFPLGLVSIGVTRPNEFKASLDSILGDFDNSISDFENSISDLNEEIEREYLLKSSLWESILAQANKMSISNFAEKGRDYALIDAKPEYNSFRNFISSSESERDNYIDVIGVQNLSKRFKINGLSDYYSQKLRIDSLMMELSDLEKNLLDFKKGGSIIPAFPDRFFVTKTNSQGEFLAQLEEGDYVVFATSSRVIGEIKESYIWVVDLPVNQNIGDLFLSNDNLVPVDGLR